MEFIIMLVVSLLIAAADQLVKLYIVANVPLYSHIPLIPKVINISYVQNTGAAFSSFEGAQWLFAVVFLVFSAAVLWEYRKKAMPFTTLERWCIVAIYGGGLGNMIDRLRLGFVVDMIETAFIDFPVFNVADCFITCGCILLLIHLFLFNKDFWKDEKKAG